MNKGAWYAALIFLLGGCAITEHNLSLNSEVPVTLSPIEQETTVALSFTDERDSIIVGKRVGGFGTNITAANLMENIEAAVRDIFTRKGYCLVAESAPRDADVQVAVRSFKYDVTTGSWTAGEHATAAFIVDGKRQGKTLKKVYRSDSERRIFFEAGGTELDQKMSSVLGDVLVQIAQDQELERFLTGK